MIHKQNPFKGLAQESLRYLAGSPLSRLRQREALRNLDDRLLADIGIARRPAQPGWLVSSNSLARWQPDRLKAERGWLASSIEGTAS